MCWQFPLLMIWPSGTLISSVTNRPILMRLEHGFLMVMDEGAVAHTQSSFQPQLCTLFSEGTKDRPNSFGSTLQSYWWRLQQCNNFTCEINIYEYLICFASANVPSRTSCSPVGWATVKHVFEPHNQSVAQCICQCPQCCFSQDMAKPLSTHPSGNRLTNIKFFNITPTAKLNVAFTPTPKWSCLYMGTRSIWRRGFTAHWLLFSEWKDPSSPIKVSWQWAQFQTGLNCPCIHFYEGQWKPQDKLERARPRRLPASRGTHLLGCF